MDEGDALAVPLARVALGVLADDGDEFDRMPPATTSGVVLLNVVFAAAAAYSERDGPVSLWWEYCLVLCSANNEVARI